MLLAITDPYHLKEGVAGKVFQALDPLVSLCDIAQRQAPGEFDYGIDPDRDAPPLPPGRRPDAAGSGPLRVLDIEALARQAAEQPLDTLRRSGQWSDRVLALYHPDMIARRVRRDPREALETRLALAFGLPDVYACLDGSRPLTPTPDWQMVNQSSGGLAMRHQGDATPDLLVGELVCLHLPRTPPEQVRVARIQWMRHDDRGLSLGLAYLTGNPRPVRCRPADAPDGQDYLGLHLYRQGAQADGELILPKRVYRRGRRLLLDTGDKTLAVEAGFLLDDTLHHDHFNYLLADENLEA